MSAELIDTDQPDLSEYDVVEQQLEEPRQEEESLPDKYRNKTASELARMHQEAEKLLGRQAQEVGEIRKLADQLIQERLIEGKKRQVEPEQQEPELTDVDFFADPVKAVNKAVESHPAVLQAKVAAVQMQQRESLNRLTSAHPDYKDIVAEDGFTEWVNKSRVRQSLFQQAHRAYDVEAADELFSTYKELKQRKAEVVSEGATNLKSDSEKALKAVAVPSGGSGETSKKIYRRADLIDLQIRDPERYMALQDEILLAYAERRVR
jgi:hypothetical protein